MKLKYFVSFIIAMIGLGGLQGCKKHQDCVASNMQLIELPQYQSIGTPDFYFLTGSFSNNEFRLTGTNKNQQCEYSEERPNSCEFEIRFLPETNLTEGTTYRIGGASPQAHATVQEVLYTSEPLGPYRTDQALFPGFQEPDTGTVTIVHLDWANNVISGRFNFRATAYSSTFRRSVFTGVFNLVPASDQ